MNYTTSVLGERLLSAAIEDVIFSFGNPLHWRAAIVSVRLSRIVKLLKLVEILISFVPIIEKVNLTDKKS